MEKLTKNNPNKVINIGSITNTLNNNSNNSLNICNPGDENINLLTNTEQKYIMSQGMNSILSLIEYLNFNERLPQNHQTS